MVNKVRDLIECDPETFSRVMRDDELWRDQLFREVILRQLREQKGLQQRSDDLAVIERVFGGRK